MNLSKFKRNNFLILLTAFLAVVNASESKNFLWKVESNTSTVYLLGSIHLAKQSLYPLADVIESAFKSSDYLSVEMNPDSVNPQDILKRAMYQDGNTLEKSINPPTFAKFDSIFTAHKIPKMMFNKYKPWYAVMTAMSLELMKGGFTPDAGIDQHFLTEAKKQNKKILELESFDAQINLMDKGISQYSEAFIDFSLKDYENSSDEIDKLLDMWKKGDSKGFENYILAYDTVQKNKEIMKMMIDDRNINMTNKIREYLKTDKIYFVVVGGGHIVGEKGIVNLLENEKKYKIKQL